MRDTGTIKSEYRGSDSCEFVKYTDFQLYMLLCTKAYSRRSVTQLPDWCAEFAKI